MVTDFELLDRWREGDRRAGNDLFDRYFRDICRFFENKVRHDTEELVQSTFLGCVQSRDRFRKQCSFRTFLFSIARRQLYKYLRQSQRQGAALDFGVSSVIDLNTGPVSYAARNQEHGMLLRALCSLPMEQQLLLELYYWEDMDNADLAAIFDIAPTTVRTRLFRARASLRERMDKLSAESGAATLSEESFDSWARSLRQQRPS